jgi:hypothetical protein
VHVDQLYALFLHENVCYERSDTICLNPPCSSSQLLLDVPASRFIPSRPARTHDTLQIPQINLSFPSFTHPHLAAATASIAEGLFAYVLSLYVARRSSRLWVDEGRYSYEAVEFELIGVGARNLLGNALRVLAAALARMAARWGVLERSAVLTLLEVVLWRRGQSLGVFK